MNIADGGLLVKGNLQVTGSMPEYQRDDLQQESVQPYPIPWEAWRVWDAFQTNLPGTAATDDLALVGGTFGTDAPSIESGNLASAGATTRYARATITIPPEYVAGQTVQIVVNAGMVGAIADNAATVDVQAYLSDGFGDVGADLVSEAAQSCNSLTAAELTFNLDATSLAAGECLDIRLTVVVNDAITGGTVKARIGYVDLRLDIKG